MKAKKTATQHQYGNALFLILIAVALFAALSYAITQSSRGGGNIQKETAELNAAQVFQYLSTIQQAVQRMQVINGCSETEISFVHDGFHGSFWAHTPPVRDACKVFHPDGGGVSNTPPIAGYAIAPPSSPCYSNTPQVSLRHNFFNGIGSDDNADLAIVICRVPQALCDIIYRHENIPAGPSATGMQVDAIANNLFTGTYQTTRATNTEIGFHTNAVGLAGKKMGCWQPASGTNKLYMTLIER